MAFKARDQSGSAHHAFQVKRNQGPFFCQVCQGAMSFVDPKVRLRPHFRHRVESNCAWEPETPDHESAKLAVCEAINRLGKGAADVEVPVGPLIADVLWTDGQHRVAFEIQRANYSWAKFTEKFLAYHQQGVAVVYLLIGPDFYQGKVKGGVRLKDVEQRLFLGKAEERAHPQWHNRGNSQTTSFMQLQRIYPEKIGRVVGGYLRRRGADSDVLLVREPIFYRGMTKAGFQSANHALETGTALSTLPEYLQAVHERFLMQPNSVFWNGLWFSRLEEAIWASFFSALGLKYT
jgi:hypothetical protein